jgi:hypothetical protein
MPDSGRKTHGPSLKIAGEKHLIPR